MCNPGRIYDYILPQLRTLHIKAVKSKSLARAIRFRPKVLSSTSESDPYESILNWRPSMKVNDCCEGVLAW